MTPELQKYYEDRFSMMAMDLVLVVVGRMEMLQQPMVEVGLSSLRRSNVWL